MIGIVAAGLSSHLPNLLVIPWLIQDYQGNDRDTKTKGNRILFFFLSLASLFGVIFGFKPVFLMLISQAAITVLLGAASAGYAQDGTKCFCAPFNDPVLGWICECT